MNVPKTPTRGAVAAGHEATVEAAAKILRAGGNAADAAIAGVFASFIAEPVLTGLFGGGVLTLRDPAGVCHVLDFFARVPGLKGAGVTPELNFEAVHVDFGPTRQEFHVGRGAAAVPGTLLGMWEAHRLWGSLPMEQLTEPACELARDGVPLSSQMAFIVSILRPILTYTSGIAELYTRDGALLAAGERFLNAVLADLLERLAREGLGGDTHRDLDAATVAAFGGGTGLITSHDLEASVPIQRQPLSTRFLDAHVFMPPPPLLGGAVVSLGLGVMEALGLAAAHSPDSALAMAQAQAAMSVARREDPKEFLTDANIRRRAEAARAALLKGSPTGSTTHISVVDERGWAVSITHSNGEGCGVVVPGTGVMMNNFLGEEDINPIGFHRQSAGEPMLSMMCPTVVQSPGHLLVLGSGGSNRIRSAILHVITNVLARGMSLETAISAPRIHVEGDLVNIELDGRDDGETRALANAYSDAVHFEEHNMFFGGVHLVGKHDDGFTGAGDLRRGGCCQVIG